MSCSLTLWHLCTCLEPSLSFLGTNTSIFQAFSKWALRNPCEIVNGMHDYGSKAKNVGGLGRVAHYMNRLKPLSFFHPSATMAPFFIALRLTSWMFGTCHTNIRWNKTTSFKVSICCWKNIYQVKMSVIQGHYFFVWPYGEKNHPLTQKSLRLLSLEY